MRANKPLNPVLVLVLAPLILGIWMIGFTLQYYSRYSYEYAEDQRAVKVLAK